MNVWCGTQDVFYIRDVVRRDLDVAIEKVEVQAMRLGGGFGGKTIATVERDFVRYYSRQFLNRHA
jgi:isoquinoline 1-oxidoreductase subunit beta